MVILVSGLLFGPPCITWTTKKVAIAVWSYAYCWITTVLHPVTWRWAV